MPSVSHPTESILIVISGPAGSGKTTLCERLLKEFDGQICRVVTTTSRDPRPGEVDGRDYHFLPADAFEKKIRAGAFIEWARVHDRYYGSQRDHLQAMLDSGRDILLNIDVQGARAFREEGKHNPFFQGRVHTIFIQPASMAQIAERLCGRGSDDEAEIKRRLRTAEEEISQAGSFDHVIVSGTREEDFKALRAYYLGLKSTARRESAS